MEQKTTKQKIKDFLKKDLIPEIAMEGAAEALFWSVDIPRIFGNYAKEGVLTAAEKVDLAEISSAIAENSSVLPELAGEYSAEALEIIGELIGEGISGL